MTSLLPRRLHVVEIAECQRVVPANAALDDAQERRYLVPAQMGFEDQFSEIEIASRLERIPRFFGERCGLPGLLLVAAQILVLAGVFWFSLERIGVCDSNGALSGARSICGDRMGLPQAC